MLEAYVIASTTTHETLADSHLCVSPLDEDEIPSPERVSVCRCARQSYRESHQLRTRCLNLQRPCSLTLFALQPIYRLRFADGSEYGVVKNVCTPVPSMYVLFSHSFFC